MTAPAIHAAGLRTALQADNRHKRANRMLGTLRNHNAMLARMFIVDAFMLCKLKTLVDSSEEVRRELKTTSFWALIVDKSNKFDSPTKVGLQLQTIRLYWETFNVDRVALYPVGRAAFGLINPEVELWAERIAQSRKKLSQVYDYDDHILETVDQYSETWRKYNILSDELIEGIKTDSEKLVTTHEGLYTYWVLEGNRMARYWLASATTLTTSGLETLLTEKSIRYQRQNAATGFTGAYSGQFEALLDREPFDMEWLRSSKSVEEVLDRLRLSDVRGKVYFTAFRPKPKD